jgi:hypothetical protein
MPLWSKIWHGEAKCKRMSTPKVVPHITFAASADYLSDLGPTTTVS